MFQKSVPVGRCPVVVSCPSGNPIPLLTVGASETCTGSTTVVAGLYTNIGTATGTPVPPPFQSMVYYEIEDVTDSDDAIIEGIGPASRQVLSFATLFLDYDLDVVRAAMARGAAKVGAPPAEASAPISAGSEVRRLGCFSASRSAMPRSRSPPWAAARASICGSMIAVSVQPGQMQFTVTPPDALPPAAAYSSAATRLIPTNPNFAATYGALSFEATRPCTDAMLITRPSPCRLV